MIITETKSHDDIQFIHDNLYEFNLSKTGAERQEIIVPDTPERTAFAVRDDDGKIFGGIVFYFKDNGETLYVELLWMAETLRGQDFGTKLITKVKDGYKLSMRSKDSNYPVGPTARKFGGGGHDLAAGATIPADNVRQVLDKILPEFEKLLAD